MLRSVIYYILFIFLCSCATQSATKASLSDYSTIPDGYGVVTFKVLGRYWPGGPDVANYAYTVVESADNKPSAKSASYEIKPALMYGRDVATFIGVLPIGHYKIKYVVQLPFRRYGYQISTHFPEKGSAFEIHANVRTDLGIYLQYGVGGFREVSQVSPKSLAEEEILREGLSQLINVPVTAGAPAEQIRKSYTLDAYAEELPSYQIMCPRQGSLRKSANANLRVWPTAEGSF